MSAPVEVVLAEAVAIRPGDRVLVALRDDDLSEDMATRMMAALRSRFPGCEFTLVPGSEGLCVLRTGDPP